MESFEFSCVCRGLCSLEHVGEASLGGKETVWAYLRTVLLLVNSNFEKNPEVSSFEALITDGVKNHILILPGGSACLSRLLKRAINH